MNRTRSAKSARPDRTTLSAADWERGALDLIAENGIRGLAIEPLARRMGITKGSFYWHFSNREALLDRALKGWEEHDARNLEASLGGTDHPRERLISFFRYLPSEKLTHDVFSALCESAGDANVEPVLERVAARRMSYLSRAFEELGMPSESATHQARLAYSSYLGFLQLRRQHQAPNLSSEEMHAYMEHVIATLLPG
jgi:AcrR family transcriptional regulator